MADLFLGDDVPLENQIKEIEREIKTRESVYPGWIANKKITAGLAEYRLRALRSVVRSLERLRGVVQ